MLGIVKYWRVAYGVLYACAASVLIAAVARNGHSIVTKATEKFDFDWAFGSWPKLEMGVIPFIGLWVLLSLLERRFPAGAVKPASGWFLNLKVTLLGLIVSPLLAVLLGVFLGYVSSS